MGMGSIGRSLKASRTNMIGVEMEEAASAFTDYFGMRDGDYIEFHRGVSDPWSATGRILSIERVFWNQRGGVTACVMVVPLLSSGRLGKTVTVTMCVDGRGRSVRQVGSGGYEIRILNSREYV